MEPLPPEYYHHADDEQRLRKRTVFLASGAIVVLAILGALGFVFAPGADRDAAVREPQDFPAVAPPGDIFVDVLPVLEQGADVDRRMQDLAGGPDGQVVPGTARHVATVTSQRGVTDLYEWDMVARFGGGNAEQVSCSGNFTSDGSSFACGFDPADVPSVGGGESGEGRRSWVSVSVSRAPEESAWLVVETDDGLRVVAAVVGGFSLAEWDGVDGRAARATLLDATLEELWTGPAGL